MAFIPPILNNYNISPVWFRANSASTFRTDGQNLRKDSFNSNPLYDNFVDRNKLTQLAKTNPNVMNILDKNNIPLKINDKELEELKNGHLLDTRITAAKIYSALPKEMKAEVNLIDLQQAAMLHDYGKVLIPDKILNKNGKLTDSEKKVMELHSELGYELLKQQGVNNNVLNLVKYHHQTPKGDGYPNIESDYLSDVSSQIIMAADKYSALREKRSYKEPLDRTEALNIIKQDVQNGAIMPEIFDALVQTS